MADPLAPNHRDGRRPVPRDRRRWIILAGVYLAIFLTIMALAYTNTLPPQLGYISYYDKIGHGVLYAIAAYLGHRVLRCRWLVWKSLPLPLFALLFGLFTVAEELVQSLSPYRTLDAGDLLWSFVGIALGTGLAQWHHRSSGKPES